MRFRALERLGTPNFSLAYLWLYSVYLLLCVLRALRVLCANPLFSYSAPSVNFWERGTSVRHVFYVFITPLCPPCEPFFFLSLCPLCSLCETLHFVFLRSRKAANLKIGVPSVLSVPSVFSRERRTSVRHVFYVYIPPPCPPSESFFFLSPCPLCPQVTSERQTSVWHVFSFIR